MIELGLFANRNSHKDFVHTALQELGDPPCNVFIAVAFFTDESIVQHLASRGCNVRVIVRLGFPTQPRALERIIDKSGIEVRYLTDPSYHPKLYLFGDRAAVVGSANMTNAALWSNQEICVSIGSEDPRLQDLASIFNWYWSYAKVLTRETLEKYSDICGQFQNVWFNEKKLGDDVIAKVGHVIVPNIERAEAKESRENLFIDDYLRTYQEFVSAFNVVRRVYERVGRRKASPDVIPLRLEIDGFVSFVRETAAKGDGWRDAKLSSGADRERSIQRLIEEWHDTHWAWFEDKVVPIHYPALIAVFGTAESIRNATDDQLFDALDKVNAFHELLRFVPGGHSALKTKFFATNDQRQLRESLEYLLYGPGTVEVRMANLLFNSAYKLRMFGQSCIQELVGWVNQQELPVVNGRTTKVMRFLGFNVRQISDN